GAVTPPPGRRRGAPRESGAARHRTRSTTRSTSRAEGRVGDRPRRPGHPTPARLIQSQCESRFPRTFPRSLPRTVAGPSPGASGSRISGFLRPSKRKPADGPWLLRKPGGFEALLSIWKEVDSGDLAGAKRPQIAADRFDLRVGISGPDVI